MNTNFDPVRLNAATQYIRHNPHSITTTHDALKARFKDLSEDEIAFLELFARDLKALPKEAFIDLYMLAAIIFSVIAIAIALNLPQLL